MRVRILLFAIALLGASAQFVAAAAPTFGGAPITPGATVGANVPLSPIQQNYVSEGGNAVPPHAVAVLAVPPGFNPSKTWPVLVVLSTSDFKRQNRDDLANLYRQSAFAEGWVLIAGDGPKPARADSSGWRAGMTLAALDELHRSFPGSKKWPVAVAGFSGGAKRAGTVAPLLAVAGYGVAGIFLTGLNDDRLSDGYRKFQPGSAFLRTPIFLSSGSVDQIAPLSEQNGVKASMQRAGFSNVRHEIFPQGHVVKAPHIRAALRWFRGGN